MVLTDSYNLSTIVAFQQRVMAQLVSSAIAIYNESANEVQTITFGGTVTGGTFTLTCNGQTTGAIQWNASAGAIHAALGALTNTGLSNVAVTGGPAPLTGGNAPVVTFVGTLAGAPMTLMTAASSLTGTSPTVTVNRTTAGAVGAVNHAQRAALASKILANPTGYSQLMALGVAVDSTVAADFNTNKLQSDITDAHIANAISAMWNSYT